MCAFFLVQMICEKPMPLPGNEFSDEFNDFIRQSLVKDYKQRPTADELLEHPFLANVRKVQSDSLQQIASRNRSSSRGTNDGDQMEPVNSARLSIDGDDELDAIRQEHLDRVLSALADKAMQLKLSVEGLTHALGINDREQTMTGATASLADRSREQFGELPTADDMLPRLGSTDSLDQSGQIEQLGSCDSVMVGDSDAAEEGRRKRFGRSLTRENTVRAWSLLPPSVDNQVNEAKWRHLAAQLYLPLSTVLRRAHEIFSEEQEQE